MQKDKSVSNSRKAYIGAMKGMMALSVAVTCGLALFLILYVLYKGLPNITWELLSTKPSVLADRIGILPDILNTNYHSNIVGRFASGGRRGHLSDGICSKPQTGGGY